MTKRYIKDFDGWHPIKKNIVNDKKPPTFSKRDIWWCSIGTNIGTETDGKNSEHNRPVLIIRKFSSRLFLGIPLTSKIKEMPFRHDIHHGAHKKHNQALISQMRAYDSFRLTSRISVLGKEQFSGVIKAVFDMLKE